MKKDYRLLINNDTMEIIFRDKIIKLTLLDREGADVASKLLKEVFIPKIVTGYDTPQFTQEPDFHEIVNSFHHDDMVIWGIKDEIDISLPDEEPEDRREICWYFDKK